MNVISFFFLISSNGVEWSDEAIDLFIKICHVGLWKVVMAKVHSYKRKDKGNMIPLVDIYDTSNKEVRLFFFYYIVL